MSRKQIVAGNWKMNKNYFEGKQLVTDILKQSEHVGAHSLLIVCPPFIQLGLAAHQLEDNKKILLGAQNCHQEKSGAYTGEISARMLHSVGVRYVILGHSERREYFGEDAELLSKKVDAALAADLKIIFCVGEQLDARDANTQNELIFQQLSGSLWHLDADAWKKIVIAYEPVWAIGTGRTATAEQAQDMHAFIRKCITEKYDAGLADDISILYGGSCKPETAEELFACPDVDGGLIGGAALNAEDFLAIASSFPGMQ